MNLPNGITIARVVLTPVIFALILSGGFERTMIAFALFIAAALSDVWDGYIARSRGLITDFGKLADPIADKALTLATFVPFYVLSHRPGPDGGLGVVPWWGSLPLWVLIVVLGRELAITLFRAYATRRGIVIAAGTAGKYKATFQSIYIGSQILWLALRQHALDREWDTPCWSFWKMFHGSVVAISLAVAVLLTAYSLLVYLWQYRTLITRVDSP